MMRRLISTLISGSAQYQPRHKIAIPEMMAAADPSTSPKM
jgi:hypothetical protein